jgi:Glycosyl transferases group 1
MPLVGRYRRLAVTLSRKVRQELPQRAFAGSSGRRVLFIREAGPIPESQIFPFFFFEHELSRRAPIEYREIGTKAFEANPDAAPAGADVVCIQTWFDLDPARAARLFGAVRTQHPNAKIVFLDYFAPTDLRLAAVVDPYVDLYVKKHVFRDRTRYAQPTRGDTLLDEYFGRAYGLPDLPLTHFPVPADFFRKLVVGPSFSTAGYMLARFRDVAAPPDGGRRIDVHARLGSANWGWYGHMRDASIRAIGDASKGRRLVAGTQKVSRSRFLSELRDSVACFSPFGYGEVCWRDYEAVLCGAVLIKQDMSHVETYPDIFVAGETYLPVAWDFSDLPEVVDRALRDVDAKRRMVRKAYAVLHEYSRNAAFVDQMKSVLAT